MGIVPDKSAFKARDKALVPIRLTNAIVVAHEGRPYSVQARHKEKVGSRPRPFLFLAYPGRLF